MLSPTVTSAITLRWVSRLRWGAAVGQAADGASSPRCFLHLADPHRVAGAGHRRDGADERGARQPGLRQSARGVAAAARGGARLRYDLALRAALPDGRPFESFQRPFPRPDRFGGAGARSRLRARNHRPLDGLPYAALFARNVPLEGMEHMHHAGHLGVQRPPPGDVRRLPPGGGAHRLLRHPRRPRAARRASAPWRSPSAGRRSTRNWPRSAPSPPAPLTSWGRRWRPSRWWRPSSNAPPSSSRSRTTPSRRASAGRRATGAPPRWNAAAPSCGR